MSEQVSATEKLKELYKQQFALFASVFNTVNGEKVIEILERDSYVNRSTVSDTSTIDPYQLAFREGMRSIILKIKNLSNENYYKQLVREKEETNN